MLTFGFILLVIAVILALVAFGIVNSPGGGPARVAFYFLLIMSLSFILYGMVLEETHVKERVPVQLQN